MHLQEEDPLPDEYDIVSCNKCGFAYADVNASQKDYNEYYCNFNMYAESNTVKSTGLLDQQRYGNAYGLICDKIGLDAKILDLGCGSGDFLSYLHKKNFSDLCGIDPSENSVRKLQEKGIEGILGNFESLGDCSEYDLVISMAVMEHIYDLDGYMLAVSKLLRKGKKAFFFCEVPAVEGFEENICDIPNYFNCEHINYFSIVSLDNLMAKVGLFRVNKDAYVGIKNETGIEEKVIHALYEKRSEEISLQYDNLAEKSISNYFDKVREKSVMQRHKVQGLLETSKRVVIWGCGSYAMQIIRAYPGLCEIVESFVDNNPTKWGNILAGKKISSPKYIENSEDVIIAVCSMKNSHDIEKELSEIAPECEVIVL